MKKLIAFLGGVVLGGFVGCYLGKNSKVVRKIHIGDDEDVNVCTDESKEVSILDDTNYFDEELPWVLPEDGSDEQTEVTQSEDVDKGESESLQSNCNNDLEF